MDLADLAAKVLIPVLAAVGTGVGGWFLHAAKHGARIESLERAMTAVQVEVAKLVTMAQAEVAKLVSAATLANTEAKLAREIESLEEDLGDLKNSLDHVSNSSHDLASAAALAAYITENNKRWEQVIRIVGRIEGTLEAQGRLQRRQEGD